MPLAACSTSGHKQRLCLHGQRSWPVDASRSQTYTHATRITPRRTAALPFWVREQGFAQQQVHRQYAAHIILASLSLKPHAPDCSALQRRVPATRDGRCDTVKRPHYSLPCPSSLTHLTAPPCSAVLAVNQHAETDALTLSSIRAPPTLAWLPKKRTASRSSGDSHCAAT